MLPAAMLRVALMALSTAAATAIQYEDCGSLYSSLSVNIDVCTTAPCDLVLGTTFNVETKFNAVFSSTKLTRESFYQISNIYMPATAVSDPCWTSTCAVTLGETKSYTVQMMVNRTLPPVESEFVSRIYNEDRRMVVCYKVPVRLIYAA